MRNNQSPSSVILGVFFASGATSLIYQVLWTRWFGLVFGNTTISVTIVLGAFMCGLALGSSLIGRRVAAMSRPLRAYAACEAGIGLFALSFPFLLQAVEAVYLAADTAGDGGSAFVQTVKVLLAFGLLCVPTGLMGATLPLLAEHFKRHPQDRSSWRVGVLYAANTIGAAAGILLAGFVLIESFGVTMTTWIAAAGNVIVAATAFLVDARHPASTIPMPTAPSTPTTSAEVRWVSIVLAVTGCLALATEVLWTRVLSTFLGTSTYAFTTIVFTYLVGIAVGSAVMSRLMRLVRDARAMLLAMVVLAGFLHTVSIEAFLHLVATDDLARGPVIPVLDILFLYGRFSLLLLPIAMASGACFPLATRILNPTGDDAEGALVARAYAANTWGSVVGSLLAGFVIAAWLDFEPSLRIILVGYVAVALVGAIALRSVSPAALPIGAVAVILAIGGGTRGILRPSFAEHIADVSPNVVLRHEASSQGMTSVIAIFPPDVTAEVRATAAQQKASASMRMLAVNHHGMTVKVTDTKMMAHIPMFLHEAPADTLVICFGMGTTFRSAMSHGGAVTVVELVGGVADSFAYFHDDAAAVRADPRGRIIIGDGRHFLMASNRRYDVITLDPPPPIDGEGVNNLYSLDFAELARDHLKPGGIVAHWIPQIGTGSGVDDEESLEMIMQTFSHAFPFTYAVKSRNHVGIHMLGSMTPIVIDEATLLARLDARPAAVVDMNELQPMSHAMLMSAVPYERKPEAILTTDDRPRLEFYLLRSFDRMNGKSLPGHLWH